MARSSYHHGNLREALIDAATTQLEASGMDKFSLSSASRAVGVSHAAAYKHFADRDALVQAVSDRAMAAFGDALQAAFDAHDTPRAQYFATGRAVVRFARTRPQLYALAFGPSRQDTVTTLADPPDDSVLQRFVGMIRSWQDAGWLREGPPTRWAMVLWPAAHGLAHLVASGRIRTSPEEADTLVDRLLTDLHEGLRP